MVFEFILALIIGIIAGTFTGLAPGIHINLIASFLLLYIAKFQNISPITAVIFIVSMSITHTFLDFIPSIFLGAPEEDTFLSILPGHELFMQGKAHEAVALTLYGSLSAIITILIFTPLFVLFLPQFYSLVKSFIPFILIFMSAYLILREENIAVSIIVFALSAFLGILTFNLPVKQPLMPLLTGLFGLSALIISLRQKPKIKKQKISKLKNIKLSEKEFFKAFAASFISAPLCSFLPGIGSGHAATLGSEIIPQERRGFLFLTGAINTIIMALSFVTVYAISRARSGSAAALQTLLQEFTLRSLITIIIVTIISSIIAFFLGIYISKLFAKFINKINYKKLTIAVIFILLAINILFTNFLGLIILLTATSIGIFTILSDSRRINLMAALIVPAIIYYLI